MAELLAHHDQRLADAERAVSDGHRTGYEVAGALLWTSRHRSFDELDLFNRMIAVNETIAHLEVLVEQNRIGKSTESGLSFYST